MRYAAVDTALTLWHMVDWLANSGDPKTTSTLTAAGFSTFDDLHSHARKQSAAVNLCWLLATGSKHRKLTGKAKKHNVIETSTISLGSTLARPGYGRYVPKIVVGTERHNAVKVFKAAIDYWECFLATHKIV
jgi:hypothetical protein